MASGRAWFGAFRHSILVGTAVAILAISILVGTAFIGITASLTNERTERQTANRLTELVDTVESTVSVACFANDNALAAEVARGLMKNTEVAGVIIRAGSEELARVVRATRHNDALGEGRGHQVRDIPSPFNPTEVVGQIIVEPNGEAMQRVVRDEVQFVVVLLGVQLAVVAFAVLGGMLLLVARPIKAMSDALHHLDATAGQQLQAPRGHADSEIGRLAGDINSLVRQLVDSLQDEKALRLMHEWDEKKYHAIFDNVEAGLFVVEADGQVSSANRAFVRLAGLPEPSPGGTAPFRLVELPWSQTEAVGHLFWECQDSGRMVSGDFELETDRGRVRWLSLVLSPVGNGVVQGVAADVTARKAAEAQALRMAVTDPLTGVNNRLGFEQRVLAHLAQPRGGQGSLILMLVDLDGFKRVNDALGLPVGDQILKSATQRISKCLKASDIVARLAGDQFAIALSGERPEQAANLVSGRLLGVLAQEFEVHGQSISMTASVGVTLYPDDGHDLPTLLRNADLALDQAKLVGGTVAFYNQQMLETVQRRRQLEHDLRQALRHNQFRFYLQPIVDLAGRRLAGAEALIRWLHPERGLVPPDVFIGLAEENGFINEIGLWMLNEVCRQLARWRAKGIDLYISLNVSGRQIPDHLSPRLLRETVAEYGIDPGHLVLEVTEGVLLTDVSQAQVWLNEVRDAGFRVYLDDFGTGYSSLSYLKRFPVDTVKIDKSFVRDMYRDRSDRALVEAIVSMANSLGLNVVAEGVEDGEQLELLNGMGCRYVQGYHFSKPLPVEEFMAQRDRVQSLIENCAQPV